LRGNADLKAGVMLGFWSIVCQFLAGVPYVSFIASVLSTVLLVISHFKLSRFYREGAIFRNTLFYFLLSVLGIVAAGLILAPIFTKIADFFAHAPSKLSSSDMEALMMMLMPYSDRVLLAVGAFYVCFVVGAYFLAKAYHLLGFESGIGTFTTAGNLLFYGAMGSIVLGLGFLVMLVGWVLAAVAYHKLQQIAFEQP
jgi:uncharacterized membrane protein